MNIKSYKIILAIISVMIALFFFGNSDFEEAARQQNEYCDMIKLWRQTNGESGWPDYNSYSKCVEKK